MDEYEIVVAPYLKVMVIDGDPLFCLLTEERLRLIGFENICVITHRDVALWRLEKYDADIIIIELHRDYRVIWDKLNEEQYRGALVVGMTFDRSGRDWLRAIENGADTVLTKPFSQNGLHRVLSQLLTSPASHRCKIVQLPFARAANCKRNDYIPLA